MDINAILFLYFVLKEAFCSLGYAPKRGLACIIACYMSSHLKSVVKWEPVEENIREELAQTEDTVHHPVGQPFCVIFFARAFDGFDSAQSWSIVKELRNMLILQI